MLIHFSCRTSNEKDGLLILQQLSTKIQSSRSSQMTEHQHPVGTDNHRHMVRVWLFTSYHSLTSPGSARGRGKLAKSLIERDYPSDTDRTRSVSPPTSVYNTTTKKTATPSMRLNTLLNDDAPGSSPAPSKGPGRGNWARKSGVPSSASAVRSFKSKLDGTQDGMSPSTTSAPTFNGPHGFYLPLNGSDPSHKRTRPLTQHQLAVEQYRRRRVDVILDRGVRIEYKAATKRRKTSNTFMRSWIRCKGIADGYDTDEECLSQSSAYPGQGEIDSGTKTPPAMPAGLVPLDFGGEVNDHGEESYYRAKMLGRALRRLDRWENGRSAVRTRSKGERRNGHGFGGRDMMDEESGDGDDDDEEMMDEERERERDDESESSDDEELEREIERERFDPNTLPPLPSMQ